MENKKIVFISGLHRSGTSILHRVISSAESVSGFDDTGVPEDEGQHLQSVFKPAIAFGGPGEFAFDEDARMTEKNKLITEENKEILTEEWAEHWDTDKPILVEKSPPNLIRTRFLQEMFPNVYFITVVRHPLAVALATKKWSKSKVERLLKHWIKAHKIYLQDRAMIEHELCFSYEYMTKYPNEVLDKIETFLGIKIKQRERFVNKNKKYFDRWVSPNPLELGLLTRPSKIIEKFESKINEYDYSLVDLERFPDMETTMNKW